DDDVASLDACSVGGRTRSDAGDDGHRLGLETHLLRLLWRQITHAHSKPGVRHALLLDGDGRGRRLGARGEDGVGAVVFSVTDDFELDALADVVLDDFADEIVAVVHGVTRNGGDDVAGADVGACGGAVVTHRVDEGSGAWIDFHRGREFGGDV